MAKDKGKPAPETETEEGEEGAAPPKKKLPMKLMLIAGAAAVVVLGGGGAAAFIFLKPKPDAAAHGKAEKPKKKAEKGKKKGDKPEEGAAVVSDAPDGGLYYTLPDIVVNMQTADGKPTFLKLKLTFEVPDQEVVDTLDPNMPRLQDMLQTFLRELRPEDLAGSQGSYQLRLEILRRVNLVVAPSRVNAVLIQEMLIN